jgi:hypothetical protein
MPRLEFENFSIEAASVEHVVIEAFPRAQQDPLGRIAALRRRYDRDDLISVARLLIDRGGRIVEVAQPVFGTTIYIRPTDREIALRPHPPFRVLPNVMTRSPFRISPSAARGHIRYRFAFRDGIEFTLPQTGEQRTTSATGSAVVDICEDCGPGLATDATTLADALKPTAWLQSDGPRIKAIAAPVAALRVSEMRKMEMLAQ